MEERFWSKVDKKGDDECWGWTAFKHNMYGKIRIDKKMKLAHRVAYELQHGAIPEGLVVRHKCDNPSCCNPNHLELGTHQDNMNDMKQRGRQHVALCERNHQAKLTQEIANEIKRKLEKYELGLCRRLAKEYGVGTSTISRIRTKKTW